MKPKNGKLVCHPQIRVLSRLSYFSLYKGSLRLRVSCVHTGSIRNISVIYSTYGCMVAWRQRSVDADLLKYGPHRELTSQQRFHVAPSETHLEHSEDRFHLGMKIPPTYQTPQTKEKVPQKTVTHKSPFPCFRRHCRWVSAHLEGRNHARPGAGALQCQSNEPGPQQVTQVFRSC